MQTIGIIGLGTMGAKLMERLKSNAKVLGFDPFVKGFPDQVQKIEDLFSCHLIIEAINEDLNAKKETYEKLKGYKGILATNTSSFSINELSSLYHDPNKFLGLHFFNPPTKMKLLEVIPCSHNERRLIDNLKEDFKNYGFEVAECMDSPGFIVNRVARSYYLEACRLLEQGDVAVEDVDQIMKSYYGFRMGPFELMDFIGIDINYKVSDQVYQAYHQAPRFRPSIVQKRLFIEKNFGQKTGKGFYEYPSKKPRVQGSSTLQEIVSLHSVPRLETFSLLEEDINTNVVLDLEGKFLDVFKSEPTHAYDLILVESNGLSSFDLEILPDKINKKIIPVHTDFEKRLICLPITKILGKAETLILKALLEKNRFKVFLVPDSPGFVGLRILSTIINEASLMLQEGLASQEDIDTAMRFGTNYPQGPFQFLKDLGADTVCEILEALQNYYDPSMYVPSRMLKVWAKDL